MRVRIALLIALAVLLAAASLLAIWQSAVLSVEAQHFFGDGTATSQPNLAQQNRANVLWAWSGALQQVVTPLATAALLCVSAVLATLAWTWEARGRLTVRAPSR